MSDDCCYPDVNSEPYNPGEIRLYGHAKEVTTEEFLGLSQLSDAERATVESTLTKQETKIMMITVRGERKIYGVSILDKSRMPEPQMQSVGVIYGYAFEGHCYTLPKPAIMLLPGEPVPVKNGECGYKEELGYWVWAVDKRARVVILDVRSDDLKTLVLDANMPGNRSPLAYSQNMALAPQRNRE